MKRPRATLALSYFLLAELLLPSALAFASFASHGQAKPRLASPHASLATYSHHAPPGFRPRPRRVPQGPDELRVKPDDCMSRAARSASL